ncbi:hypothetical protein OsJ_02676 [Oryza sativa Japonica Group]|uniref:Alpha/beta hydrolase fold-3 domain-containing protein n=1 Tax=Oryza sativa subsp. japonica TaxID=39947 RepID=A2ZVL1_ORYSJ|nr:hypothetical protein OsJ_02676 [Oryza sativa Japonica Group]
MPSTSSRAIWIACCKSDGVQGRAPLRLLLRAALPPAARCRRQETPRGGLLPWRGVRDRVGCVARISPLPQRPCRRLPCRHRLRCYRLTLEHPLPAAYEDSTAALAWVLSVADPWLAAHGPLSRVFLAGDSASDNIYHHLVMCHGLTSQHLSCRLKGIVMIHPWFWGKEPIGGKAATWGAEGAMGVRVPRRGGRRG